MDIKLQHNAALVVFKNQKSVDPNKILEKPIISNALPIIKTIWSYKVFFTSFVGQALGLIQQNAIKEFVERLFKNTVMSQAIINRIHMLVLVLSHFSNCKEQEK
jgi:hypothetical protein